MNRLANHQFSLGLMPTIKLSLAYQLGNDGPKKHVVVELCELRETADYLQPLNICVVALHVPGEGRLPEQSLVALSENQFIQLSALANRFHYHQISVIMQEHLSKTPFNELTCAICLKHHDCAQVSVRLRCLHIFHGDCILSWVAGSCQCPMCRADME